MTRLALVIESERARGDEARGSSATAPWLPALRRGEPAAIASCYAQHANALLALAFRLTGNQQDAEDVVHDVFVGLPEALRKYEERGQFAAWLKRVTARTALMHQRRANDRRETPRDVDIFPSMETSDAAASGASVRGSVATALRALTPALRQVFVLKVVEGYSHADIGHLLGITAGTSEVRLTRAIAKLRTLLGGHS